MTAGLNKALRKDYEKALRKALDEGEWGTFEILRLSLLAETPARLEKIHEAAAYLLQHIDGISTCKADREASNGGCTEPHVSHMLSARLSSRPMSDLKKVYGAVSEDAAMYALEEFQEKWSGKYPQIYKSWAANWADLSGFFKYPEEMRRLIYTTNAVEGFHRMLRKFTKTKANFPTDDALRKSIYLSVKEISKKWNQPIRDWGIIIGQFMVFYEERFAQTA